MLRNVLDVTHCEYLGIVLKQDSAQKLKTLHADRSGKIQHDRKARRTWYNIFTRQFYAENVCFDYLMYLCRPLRTKFGPALSRPG